jgi:hypothetical protein
LSGEPEPRGAHLENLVLLDLLAWRDLQTPRPEVLYWRTADGADVPPNPARARRAMVEGAVNVSAREKSICHGYPGTMATSVAHACRSLSCYSRAGPLRLFQRPQSLLAVVGSDVAGSVF